MEIHAELTSKVLEFLNINAEYALLRNYEGLPDLNTSRDIDIIIGKKDLYKNQVALINLINESGWKIITYLDNGRLVTFVCSRIHKKQIDIIQWDFFFDTSVHGVTLIEAEELLKDREFNGILYHVSKPYEFLDKYVYNRTVGAPYPEKYQKIREEVGESEQVKSKLKSLYGTDNLEVIDTLSPKKLLKRSLRNNLTTQFFKSIGRISRSQCLYFSSFISSRVAVRIGFTGPDGAGKTTVIELLKKQISSVFGSATENYHFRPTLIPNLGEAAHSKGFKKEIDQEYGKPHRSAKKGKLNSFIRLSYYTVDYLAGFWIKVKPHCRLTKFIIFDRYYTDIITDSRRSSINLSPKLLYIWSKIFIPSLHYNILLTADKNIILARKQELDAEGIDRINYNLNYLSNQKGYYLILNNSDPMDAVEKILDIVFHEQHLKNMKRFGKK